MVLQWAGTLKPGFSLRSTAHVSPTVIYIYKLQQEVKPLHLLTHYKCSIH